MPPPVTAVKMEKKSMPKIFLFSLVIYAFKKTIPPWRD